MALTSPGPGTAPIELLACGRDAARVWEHALRPDGPDEHERDCPHCRATVADARALRAVADRLAAEPLEPSASVMERVMTSVLAELRPHDHLRLASPHGPVRLDRAAAAAVLRHAVDRMPGMRARSCRLADVPRVGTDGTDGTDGIGGADRVEVVLTVAAGFGLELASAAARVRQMVVAAAERSLGLPVERVDIEVVDVLDPGPEAVR